MSLQVHMSSSHFEFLSSCASHTNTNQPPLNGPSSHSPSFCRLIHRLLLLKCNHIVPKHLWGKWFRDASILEALRRLWKFIYFQIILGFIDIICKNYPSGSFNKYLLSTYASRIFLGTRHTKITNTGP